MYYSSVVDWLLKQSRNHFLPLRFWQALLFGQKSIHRQMRDRSLLLQVPWSWFELWTTAYTEAAKGCIRDWRKRLWPFTVKASYCHGNVLGLLSFIILPYKTSAYSVAVFLFKFRLDFYFIIFKNSCFVKSFEKP